MKNAYDILGESFRALSVQKLGTSVLELCADEDRDSQRYEIDAKQNTETEKER